MEFINVSSEKELNDLGYIIPEEHREQIDIIFNDESLKTQARIEVATLGFCVGVWNKLVAFVEQKMEFKNLTIEEFNKIYGTPVTKEMNIGQFTNHIETKRADYVYASLDSIDVTREYKEFLEEVGHECDLVCVEGLFLAMY